MRTATHLAQASCTELTLQLFFEHFSWKDPSNAVNGNLRGGEMSQQDFKRPRGSLLTVHSVVYWQLACIFDLQIRGFLGIYNAHSIFGP